MSGPFEVQSPPLFSVVIPAFNRPDLLRQCLQSLLSQSFGDFEAIIVDDGSSPSLRPVVDACNDPRLRFMAQENAGPSAARNTGILAARGKYIAFLDSDDQFLPQKLEVCRDVLVGLDGKTWVAHATRMVRNNGLRVVRPGRARERHEDFAEYICVHRQFLPTLSVVVPSACARQVLFDPCLKSWEDPDFLIRLELAGFGHVFIPRVLGIWNDVQSGTRVTASNQLPSLRHWESKMEHRISARAMGGFRLSVLAPALGWKNAAAMFHCIQTGARKGRLPLSMLASSLARCLFPPRLHRFLVDLYFRSHAFFAPPKQG